MTLRGTNGYVGRNAFLFWLTTLPPDEIVGTRGKIEACPIATVKELSR